MKFTSLKGLMFVLIISMTFTATIKREKEAVKTATKSDGSGNWNDGLTNPRIEVTQLGNNASIRFNTNNWFIKTSNLDNMKEGLEIKLLKPLNTAEENEVLVGNNPANMRAERYIPWRYINSEEVAYEKRTLSNKIISFQIDTDSGKTFKVVLVWAYATIGNFITQKECDIVRNKITSMRDSVKRQIKSLKSEMITTLEDQKIETDKKLAAQLDAKKMVDNAKAENAQIKQQQNQLLTQLAGLKMQMMVKDKENAALNAKKDVIDAEILKLSSHIETDTTLLDDNKRKEEIAKAEKNIAATSQLLIQELNNIRGIAKDANSKKNLDTAQEEGLKADINKFDAAMNNIQSK